VQDSGINLKGYGEKKLWLHAYFHGIQANGIGLLWMLIQRNIKGRDF